MNKILMEFVGTLFFVYVALATKQPLAIGATLALLIYMTNGNFNPVFSIVMATVGKIQMHDLLPYVVSQVAGGLAALELYRQLKY